jgi:hypothetical protein
MGRARRFLDRCGGWPLWAVVLLFVPLVAALIVVELEEEAEQLPPEDLAVLSQSSML